MSMGFQITESDVTNVLDSHNVDIPADMEDIMSMIDDAEVESAALSVDIDPDDDEDLIFLNQTEAAYDEIAWQLYKAGFISKEQISKYGNTDILTRVE